jgi:hypothetical protein
LLASALGDPSGGDSSAVLMDDITGSIVGGLDFPHVR